MYLAILRAMYRVSWITVLLGNSPRWEEPVSRKALISETRTKSLAWHHEESVNR